jgi:hypothetical protein
MGKACSKLDDNLMRFIETQKPFFVATAPLGADGQVNVSPKGWDAFNVIDEATAAYLDLGGSGIETQAHVQSSSSMFTASPTAAAGVCHSTSSRRSVTSFAAISETSPQTNGLKAAFRKTPKVSMASQASFGPTTRQVS